MLTGFMVTVSDPGESRFDPRHRHLLFEMSVDAFGDRMGTERR
jgi:hypothetical protein